MALATEYESLLRGLVLGSLGFFILTPIVAPVAIVRMPPDILIRKRRPLNEMMPLRRAGFLLWHLIKNLAGVALMLLGILLLFLPGQGLLTLFAGTMLADIPGKKTLLSRLLGAKGVRTAIDRMRAKYHREPLIYPEDSLED